MGQGRVLDSETGRESLEDHPVMPPGTRRSGRTVIAGGVGALVRDRTGHVPNGRGHEAVFDFCFVPVVLNDLRAETRQMNSAPNTRPFVSVIIPAYNEASHLRECLASLVAQDYPNYEVILVDNASTDDTAEVCGEFYQVRYIYFNRVKSSYGARNEGARHASGEILFFFDADQTALPNLLSDLLEEYKPGDRYHIYSARLDDDPRVPEVLRMCFSFPAYSSTTILTAALAVPKKLFDELGGFDEQLLSSGDIDFFERAEVIAKIHRRIMTTCYHYWATSVDEVLRRQERYGFGICIRAQRTNKKLPSITWHLIQLFFHIIVKLCVVIAIPVRYPKSEWIIRWKVQFIQLYAEIYFLIGILKFKFGYQRAGDLPLDASIDDINLQSSKL